jgi:AraC-like DNA-binding protein
LRLLPYVLGYAGAYDVHPALTFAPFDLTLAWGPLLWIYTCTLSTGAAPASTRWHLLPVVLQFAYQMVCFALPLELKWAWYTGAHLQIVEPWGALAVLLSLGAYSAASWRQYAVWQRWLDGNISNREESRLTWLGIILVGLMTTGALGAVMMGVHLVVRPLDYFARLPIIIVLAVLTYLIGLLGFRFGREAIPMTAVARSTANEEPTPVLGGVKDYAPQAAAWEALVLQHGWHRNPQLTLTTLAQAIGTSPRTLSRTLSEGLGLSFHEFINGLRVRDAVARLGQSGTGDLLRVALDVGFASKASFNRAFKRHAGTTPSALRAAHSVKTEAQLPPKRPMAGGEATE